MNPYAILDDQYKEQLAGLESTFGEQENLIRSQAAQQHDALAQRYNLERRYIEQTPMEWEDRRGKIQDLNKKYEMKVLELDQKVQPLFGEIQSKKMQARAKLDQGRNARQMRLDIITDMAQRGIFRDQESALQEQLQTLGVSVPIGALRGPSREMQMEDVQGELRAVGQLLDNFVAPHKGKWGGKVPLMFSPASMSEEEHEATPEEKALYEKLTYRQAQLRQSLADLLTNQQAAQPGLHPFSGATARVSARRSETFQGQAAGLVPQRPQQAKPVTRELVQSLAAQGLNRQEAEQWLRRNGYDVNS